MNYSEAKEAVNKLEKLISDLQIYSWNEIFENLPDGDETKDEIECLLDNGRDAIADLKEFFK